MVTAAMLFLTRTVDYGRKGCRMDLYQERIGYFARRYLKALDSLEHTQATAGRTDLPLIAAVCTVLEETDSAIEDALLENELCQ